LVFTRGLLNQYFFYLLIFLYFFFFFFSVLEPDGLFLFLYGKRNQKRSGLCPAPSIG